jgi:hypothetical protein
MTSVTVAIVVPTGRLADRDGRVLRTRTGNNRAVLTAFLAPDALTRCSVRHRFNTLT